MKFTSKKQKAKVYQVYNYLKLAYPEWVSREEIVQNTGIPDRTVRDCIARIRFFVPVLSFSSQKGYKLALTEADMADALHTLAEMQSRRDEIAMSMRPLIIFKKYGRVVPIKGNNIEEEFKELMEDKKDDK